MKHINGSSRSVMSSGDREVRSLFQSCVVLWTFFDDGYGVVDFYTGVEWHPGHQCVVFYRYITDEL